jgi:hypothetical protein
VRTYRKEMIVGHGCGKHLYIKCIDLESYIVSGSGGLTALPQALKYIGQRTLLVCKLFLHRYPPRLF